MARVNAREVSAAPPPAPPAGAITAEAAGSIIAGGGGTPTVHGPVVHGPTVLQPTELRPITAERAPQRPTTPGPARPGRIGHDVTIDGGTFDSGTGDAPVRPLRPLPDIVKLTDVSPDMVTRLPGVANFVIMQPGAVFTPAAGADSVEAVRFKAALSDTFNLVQASTQAAAPPPRTTMNLGAVAGAAAAALDPARTIPRRVLAGIFVPPRIQEEIGDGFVEPMAYPVIDAADVRAAQEPVLRVVPAEHQPDRAEQRHPARDQPAVHRVVHGRSQPRVRARAAVARVPDRPARLDVPPVLGRAELLRARRGCRGAQGEAARHPPAAPVDARLCAGRLTTTARQGRRTRTSWCSSSAASC